MKTLSIPLSIPLSILLTLLCTPLALAQSYEQLLTPASELTFAYTQMGVGMQGRFARFDAKLSFNPEKPQAAHTAFEVDLASIDTGFAEANEEVLGKDWFNAAAHPKARFISQTVRRLGPGRYEVQGQLTIKGQTRTAVAPFTFTAQGQRAIFEGAFTIHRLDYNIGEGPWADISAVANEVRIQFRLVAMQR